MTEKLRGAPMFAATISDEPRKMKAAANSSRKSDLPALTSLRFVAAVAVLASHLSEVFDVGVAALKDLALWQGVSCFFVLSGFILAYVHPQLEGAEEKDKFMVARIARIWPTHVAAFILYPSDEPHLDLALKVRHDQEQSERESSKSCTHDVRTVAQRGSRAR